MNTDQSSYNGQEMPAPIQTDRLTLETIYLDKIFDVTSPRMVRWMKDSKRISYLDFIPTSELNTVWIYDSATNERQLVIPLEKMILEGEETSVPVGGYLWSPDETLLLLVRPPRAHEKEFDTSLVLYSLVHQKLERVASRPEGYRNIKWAPDGRHLGYVVGNELYIFDIESRVETRLTGDATETRYNGRFGWVYQEELALVDGWEWSSDGAYIAYYQIDETNVPTVELTRYDEIRLTPEIQRYPKAGDTNPTVRIGLIDLRTLSVATGSGAEAVTAVPKTQWVDLGPDHDIYIVHMQWTPTGELWLQRIPRLQNRLELLRVDLENHHDSNSNGSYDLKCTTLLSEADDAWVDAPGALTFVGASNQFIWPSEKTGHRHLYLYGGDGTEICPLTSGEWDVDHLLAAFSATSHPEISHSETSHSATMMKGESTKEKSREEKSTKEESTKEESTKEKSKETGRVFFSAIYPTSRERQILAVNLDGTDLARLTLEEGVHQVTLSPDGRRFLDTFSRKTLLPTTTLFEIGNGTLGELAPSGDMAVGDSVLAINVARIHQLWPHKQIGVQNRARAESYIRSHWHYTPFTTEGGVSLEAALLYPPDFDPTNKYPVLMYTYGGPGSQVVIDAYGSRVGLEQYLSQEGLILAMVDGRGTGGRGREFKKVTYLNLGYYEVEDQIAGAKWLAGLEYVDASRIGIWGWSYGGYVTSLCILRGADVFRSAVAVAPVTHWKYYDTIYTERYMRRPEDNSDAYTMSAPVEHLDRLTGDYLLMHGLADDNVHFQNAADITFRLQRLGKHFEMMAYPGKHHGLEGVGLHWATTLCNFIGRTLLK